MATLQSTTMLSRTRSGRVPGGKLAVGSASDRLTAAQTTGVSGASTAMASASSSSPQISIPTSNVSVFLTNLHLLDLDLRPDWPDITARTFAAKDATQGQKKRIQSVEWALYQLFCLWDPEEARSKMKPYFPPADQVQSVTLRAALLRALEQAKKNGVLGRDVILRKTMLDECRGDRLEEILAVFSSAVLKKVVTDDLQFRHASQGEHPAVAKTLALESRSYSAERTQLNALIVAHKASLSTMLRKKEVARARYKDFAELLDLKERTVARRREAAKASEENGSQAALAASLSNDAKLDLWRLVRNNWSGHEQWMDTLLYGGDDRLRKDTLLSTAPDRVWRRVQAGRLGELESRTDGGLLEQLERRVDTQHSRLQQWEDYRRHAFGKHGRLGDKTSDAPKKAAPQTKTGIDLGFGAHDTLYPAMMSPRKGRAAKPIITTTTTPTLHNSDYADLLQSLEAELAQINRPHQQDQSPLAVLLQSQRAGKLNATKGSNQKSTGADEEHVSDISDIDEHPIVVQPPPPAPASEGVESPGPSPSRQRKLLTKKSLTFSVKPNYYHSDEESEPELLPKRTLQRAATIPVEEPVRRPRPAKEATHSLPFRQRQQSPPIRPPKASAPPPPSQSQPALRTPSPDRSPSPSPPPPDDEPPQPEPAPRQSVVVHPPPEDEPTSPSQELADQILASMQNASPSPVKRPRHTLSLAERTRLSMARISRNSRLQTGADGDDDEDDEPELDTLTVHRNGKAAAKNSGKNNDTMKSNEKGLSAQEGESTGAYEDLVARTRKSMVGFEASRQKAQLERRRSQRKSRQSSSVGLGVGGSSRRDANGGYFPTLDEGDGDGDTTLLLAEELMSGQQDDAEAIFRSRPKIKMSPIPSPTRELEMEEE